MSSKETFPDFEWDIDPLYITMSGTISYTQRDHNSEMRIPASGIFNHALNAGVLTEE